MRRIFLTRLIQILILLIVLHTTTVFCRSLALALIGRGARCSIWQALKAPNNTSSRLDLAMSIEAKINLVRSDANGFDLWETPQGAFWAPKGTGSAIIPVTLADMERKVYGTVRPGDVVLDCGANLGIFTREAVRSGARLTVAIEPAPDNLECLRRTFATEIAEGRVIVYPKGVGDKEELLTLHVNPKNSMADTFLGPQNEFREGPKLALTTIDKLVAERGLDRVDFIKMDIEGFEKKALMGARETLAKFRPRMAIASEHLLDDAVRIPEAVWQLRPDYSIRCGLCMDAKTWLHPEVLFFY
jgi:FkbM family methyltransferase